MNRLIMLTAASAAFMALPGTGPAGAATSASPSVSGQKFSDASTALKKAGYAVEVATSVGDQLARSNCLVTTQRDEAAPPNTKFPISEAKTVVLSLNCYATKASANEPGPDAGRPNKTNAAAPAKSRGQ